MWTRSSSKFVKIRIRRIRTLIEKGISPNDVANIYFLETVMKLKVGDPPPFEESSLEESNGKRKSDEDME